MPRRKGKDTIINEMVVNAADVMEAKAEYFEMVAAQFDEKGDTVTAAHWRRHIPGIVAAVALIRENAGCWS